MFCYYKHCLNVLVNSVLKTTFEPMAGDVKRKWRRLLFETHDMIVLADSLYPKFNVTCTMDEEKS